MRFFVLAALFCLVSVSASADTLYEVSGTFGSDLQGTTGVAGGTFVGTFEAAGFPTTVNGSSAIDSYTFTVYNSSGDEEYSFSGTNTTSGFQDVNGNFVSARFGDGGAGAGIGLNFAEGFDGTGAVLPFNMSTLPYASGFEDPSMTDIVGVASGYAQPVPSTPEPSSMVLISGGLAVAFALRRRLLRSY